MNPLDYIKLAIGAVLVALVFYLGYRVGDWSGESARATLAAEKVKQEEANQSLKTAVDQLKKSNEKLTADYEATILSLKATSKASDAQWSKLSAQQGSTISTLKSQINATQANLAKLKDDLAKAHTPEEKAKIEEEIKSETNALTKDQTRATGLECLRAVVPSDYLSFINQP